MASRSASFRITPRFRLAVSLGLLVAATVLFAVRSPRTVDGIAWEHFVQVLVPSTVMTAERSEAIHDSLPAVITFDSATVEVENFAGGESIAISQLKNRFDESDPRIDPFLRAAADLFTVHGSQGTRQVLYVPRDDHLRNSLLDLERIVPADAIEIPERGTHLEWLLMGGVVAAFLILAIISSTPFYLLVPALGYSLWSVHLGGPGAMVRAICFAVALVLFLEERDTRQRENLYRRRFPTRISFAGIALFTFLSVGTLFFEDFPRAGAVELTLLLLTVPATDRLRSFVVARRFARSEHRLFSAVPIVRRSVLDYFSTLFSRGFIWAPATAIVVVFALHFAVPVSDFAIPVPAVDGEEVPVASMLEESLGMNGYLAHRAYQSAMMYGWDFQTPERGETITLRGFSRSDETIRADERVIFAFDERWFEDALSSEAAPSLYTLFVLEEPTRFVRRATASPAAGTRLPYLALIALAGIAVPLFTAFRLRFALSAGRFALSMKRKRQEA